MTQPEQIPGAVADHRQTVLAVMAAMRGLGNIDDLPLAIAQMERFLELAPTLDPKSYFDYGNEVCLDVNMMKAALPLWELQRDMLENHSEGKP